MIIKENENSCFVRVPATENYIFINKGEREEILTSKQINTLFNSKDNVGNDVKVEDIKIDKSIYEIRRNKIKDVKELANAIVLLRKEDVVSKVAFENKVEEILKERDLVKGSLKDLESKSASFNQVSKYLITYNEHRETYEQYGHKRTKFGGYKKYESEILLFLHAKEKLEELDINTNVNIDKLKEKIIEQRNDFNEFTKAFNFLDKRINSLRDANNIIERNISNSHEKNRELDI